VNGAALKPPLSTIRAVAVDATGAIYLTDSTAQRVVKLDPAGHYVTAWGSPGAAPGRFGNTFGANAEQGPMGIAVGPNGHVYVADTWNHRVQEFTPGGAVVRTFGAFNPAGGMTASSFFGPRQLAVAPNGNLYVADTGNERIQVYSPQGVHLFNIGAGSHNPETALGRFDEPSGVAIDKKGVVYVADYWDKRIQRFTLAGKPIAPAFPVAGWGGPNDYGEPYLAVDNKGHLFATDAPATNNTHVNHVLELDATTGRLIRAYGGATSGALIAPSGIAVGPDGALYIADVGAVKLLKVQP
jgi:DNA-binding beta-propeller fold protein YncE